MTQSIRWRSQQIFLKQNLYLRSKIDYLNKFSTLILILVSLSIGSVLLYSTSTEERHVYLPKVLPLEAPGPPNSSSSPFLDPNSESQNTLKEVEPPAGAKGNPPVPAKQPDQGSPSGVDNHSPPKGEKDQKFSLFDSQDTPSQGPDSQSITLPGGEITFNISLASDYPKPPPYIVAICGEAPTNSIVALYNNGRLCDTVPSKIDRFLFPRVRLKSDRNLLQAKLITPDGNFYYSNKLELVVDVATSQIQEKGIDFRRGSVDQSRICLSFDGGSNADASSLILDILKTRGIQTTIFLTGEYIRRNPGIVRQMVEEGHEIGNHTDTHPHLAKFEGRQFKCLPWVNREFVQRELRKAEESFYHLTGKNMSPYWRAPYGESNLEIRKWAEELGYRHISWTCGRAWEDGLDSLDWVTDTSSVRYHTADEIRDQIINFGLDTRHGANGGIVLMHLSTARSPEDAVYTRLPEIIDGLRQKKYQLVKISELVEGTLQAQNMIGHLQKKNVQGPDSSRRKRSAGE
ncbi:MAG: polysaccharide deacetylase family protein [bacterium]